MSAQGWDKAQARAVRNVPRRVQHMALLRAILESGKARDKEASDCADMLSRLQDNNAICLTDGQRKYAGDVAERCGVGEPEYENLVSSGRVKPDPNFPKLDFERMPRPLKPPGRK